MAHSSPLRLLVLHALRLKGVAEADTVAEMMATDPTETSDELAQLEELDLVSYRHGRIPGYKQTPEGRVHGERLLHQELERSGTRPAIERAYREFLRCNDDLLALCTAWQLRTVDGEPQINDHLDADYDASVREQLVDVHQKIDPVLEALSVCLNRFEGHRTRLRTALERVQAGDHAYFTKPMFPSYHAIWFELHEDLLATLGTERAPARSP